MKKSVYWLAGFIIVKFILQFTAINPVYELQRDEYLHLDQARHLAWGYISLPPFSSWIAYIIQLLGNGVFWVKFFPALFGALTIVLVWNIIKTLGGNLYALCLGAAAITFSVLVRLNTLFQPNSTDVFFWTLFYYIIIKYVKTENVKWLYAAGVAAGFGFLSKYNFAFLLLGLLPAILFTEQRRLFTKKAFYAAVIITFIIVLPNLLWQYQNNFPTLRQLNELVKTQLENMERPIFIKDQLLYFINAAVIIIAAIAALFFYKPFKPFRFIGIAFFITVALYLWLKAKSYYAAGLYPVLIAMGAAYLGAVLQTGWKKYLRGVLLLFVIVMALPLLYISLPYKSPAAIKANNRIYKKVGMLRWEDGKEHSLPMDFADMVGWKELAAKTDSVYAAVTDKEHTLVLCSNYGQAGAINYYSRFKDINAVSFNADYINWIPLNKPVTTVISVKFRTDTSLQKERQLFKTVQRVATLQDPDAMENGTGIYLLQEPFTDIIPLLEKEIARRKTPR